MMDWQQMILAILNSDAVATAIAALAAYMLTSLFVKQPKWKQYYDQYKGTITEGIKWAEKQIPDGTQNPSLWKLDQALKYVIRIQGLIDSQIDQTAMRQAIDVRHAELEQG